MATGPGKGKSPANTQTEWPETRDEFVKWFWSGTNGNDLIRKLNCSDAHGVDYIRREKERPTIYGIVLNDGLFPGKEGKVQWKLCKVGFTHVNTAEGTNNRMEQVIEKIKTKRKADAAVLFVFPIGAVDVTTFSDTEKRIRNVVGWPLGKELAKDLGLPCSTEWVLTTQPYIDKINSSKEYLKAKGSSDLIDLFKDLKFNPAKTPSWVTLKDVKGVPTVMELQLK